MKHPCFKQSADADEQKGCSVRTLKANYSWMNPIAVLLIFGLLIAGKGNAQQLIGLSKTDVMKTVQEDMKNFNLDNTSKNTTFNYLKYIDKANEQTLLCMLSEQDVCTSVKLISDYMNLDEKLEEMNSRYTRVNDSTWVYTHEKKKYQVTLRKEEWFFSIRTRAEAK